MFDKMKQLYEMQRKAKELQRQMENLRAEKATKDGLIKVAATGAMRLASINIDPSYLAVDQKATLEKTLLSVINDALSEAQKQSAAQAAELMKGMEGLNIPGL